MAAAVEAQLLADRLDSVGVVVSGAVYALGASVLAGFRLALLYFFALIRLCVALSVLSLRLRRKLG